MCHRLGHTELRSVPCVAGHEPGRGRIKVSCEVFQHSLKLLQGRGLAPEYVDHDLEPETEIQGVEVWRVGGQLCSDLRKMILLPNFDLRNSNTSAVQCTLAPSCWNQYCFVEALPRTAGRKRVFSISIYGFSEPVDGQHFAIHVPNPGHDLGSVSMLAVNRMV